MEKRRPGPDLLPEKVRQEEERSREGQSSKPKRQKPGAKEWSLSIGAIAACTGIAVFMRPYTTVVDAAMVYLLGIVLVSSRAAKGPSLLATFLSVAAYDFFFIHPFYTFTVNDARYFITFIVMFVIASVISTLTLRIRNQAEAAKQRELRTAALYSLSRKLVHERGIEQLSDIAIKHISDLFSSYTVVVVPEESGKLIVPAKGQDTLALDEKEMSVAQWSFDHRQRAGLGTDTLSSSKVLYLPLVAASKAVGVIGILPRDLQDFFVQDQVHILESFADQLAMALDRAFLSEEAQQALLRAETETLRNTMLSSVSHDLRTPLAAITGAATTLLQQDAVLDQHNKRELTQTIAEEAEHLNQIIRNVLDMTRLESRAITIKKEWQSLEEIVGVVLNRLFEKLKDRHVAVRLPDDLPLVPFDPLLIEQVLRNLFDNALKYTPPGSPLDISASVGEAEVTIELADRGPGLPPGREEHIFEKFVRGPGPGGGLGLGLAICRAIVTAHGGSIWAENRAGGGVAFRFTLPLGGEQPTMEREGA